MPPSTVAGENTTPTATRQKSLLPPEERLWKRYSPHHEGPLSAAGSLALHALVIGALAYLAFRATQWQDDELNKPPRMEVVEIQGGDGGLDGLGVGTTPLGGTKGGRTDVEAVASNKQSPQPFQKPNPNELNLKAPDRLPPQLKVPVTGYEEPADDGDTAFSGLSESAKRAEASLVAALTPPAPKAGTKGTGGNANVGGVPGTGGRAGSGGGKGGDVGPGSGSSPYGQVLTNQRKRQMRWKILASDDGQVHLAKLKALKLTLVVPTANPNVFEIMDLGQSAPQFKTTTNLRNQGDKVWWTNRHPKQVAGLAAVLGLRRVPPCFVIFLPKALEDRMLDLEQAHQGAREEQIQLTVWDVPLRDGHYAQEPEVVQQILRGR
jgi:hypothetical protein